MTGAGRFKMGLTLTILYALSRGTLYGGGSPY
jgi:hypothetical protein